MRTTLRTTSLTAALAVLFTSLPLSAQEVHREILRQKFQQELERIVDDYDGVAGVHVVDLTDGTRFDVRGDLVFPQASAIKVAILLELFHRADSDPTLLEKRVEMTDAVRTAGSGVLQLLTNGGSALSLEDYAIYMVVYSDNTATNVLIDELGMDAINRLTASLGAPNTKVQRKMIREEESARGNENVSTPQEAARIMERIASCELPMSRESCARVRQILEIYKEGPVRTPVPRTVPIAYKPGSITGVATVWALVGLEDRPYVLSVMTNYGGDGDAVVEAASAAAYRYFTKLVGVTPYGVRVSPEVKRRVGVPPGAPRGGPATGLHR